MNLEDVLQPKLNVSRHVLLSANSSKRGWRVDACGRAAEDHPVEEVKEFRSELKEVTLTDPEIFQDAEIFIQEREGTNVSVVRRRISESKGSRLREGIDIQIPVKRRIELSRRDRRTPTGSRQAIRSVAAAKEGNIGAAAHANGGTRLVALNAGDLPPPDQVIQSSGSATDETLSPPKRKFIGPRQDQVMGAVETCQASLAVVVLHVQGNSARSVVAQACEPATAHDVLGQGVRQQER